MRRILNSEELAMVDDLFTYHQPNDDQIKRLNTIRSYAKSFAEVILMNTPKCADQTAALRKLRECVMTANASIVLERVNG